MNTSNAGTGSLIIKVFSDKAEVPVQITEHDKCNYSACFVPQSDQVHTVEVYFNNVPVPHSPFSVNVQSRLESIIIFGKGLKSAQVNEKTVFFIKTDGIQANEFDIIVTDTNRSPLPVKCYQQKNGSLLVEWIPKRIGSHKIEVLHSEKPLIGSPFSCEVYDASKVKVQPIESSNYVINKQISMVCK